MSIEYKDVKLRAIEESDLELLLEMMNDSEIQKMVVGSGAPVSMYQQKKWFESLQTNKNELRLMIETKEHGTIGLITLTSIDYINRKAEFSYKIASSKNIRGSGYGTKAYIAIINYAFYQLNLNCINSENLEYNTVTEHIKKKLGFIKEGILRERVFRNGKYHNTHIWSLLKKDWEEVQKSIQ